MNYYEHHLGDWAAATSHLTWDEDMAYTRLLRAYYHAERAIPQGQQYRLAKASTSAQRKAVDAVLAEFFVLVDGNFHQKRADAEIARFQDKQRKAKASANARWSQSERNANASADAMRTHSEGNALQTPDTIPNTDIARAMSLRAGEEDPPTTPSPYTAVCVVLRSRGVARVNPSHPMLRSLVDAGATPDEFAAYAEKAAGKSDPFAYILGAVKGERERAASAATVHRGPMPSGPKTVEGESVEAYQARIAAERKAERERLAQQAGPTGDVKAKLAELRGLRVAQ